MYESHALAAFGAFALLGGCAQQQQQQPPAGGATVAEVDSILVSSVPAAGASVAAPVDQLVLRFSPPARLDEVIVAGPQGSVPMMITPVGEVGNYSLPLPELGAGNYTVRWRATASGKEHQGRFSFAVR